MAPNLCNAHAVDCQLPPDVLASQARIQEQQDELWRAVTLVPKPGDASGKAMCRLRLDLSKVEPVPPFRLHLFPLLLCFLPLREGVATTVCQGPTKHST